jgi:dipeptidyl aminopeptidase/acylaminoacyl peptidase
MPAASEDHFVEFERIWPEGAWPCFSPDGRRLVFTGDLERANNRLMILSADGAGEPEYITPPDLNAKRPTWLHRGREIAFNRDQTSIWTIDLDTGRIEPFLPESPARWPPFVHPCAYPNERAVAAVRFRETANGREGVLCKVTPSAAAPILQLTTFPEVCAGRPGVSPDGETVVFAGNAGRFAQGANQLWVVKLNGKPLRLEQDDPVLAQGRAPRWSPDGKWIACTSTRPALKPKETTPKAVWIISADGKEAHRLTDRSMNPLHVAWSPDQKRLACGGIGCGLALLDLPERFHAGGEQGP